MHFRAPQVTTRPDIVASSEVQTFAASVGDTVPCAVFKPSAYPPLGSITRPTVDTDTAAYYLNRQPQTLRIWACKENGPIRPFRINGRLAWPVAELCRVLGVSA